MITLNVVVTTLAPGPLSDPRNANNPLGLEEHPRVASARDAVGLLPLYILASALSLLVRDLRSGARLASISSG